MLIRFTTSLCIALHCNSHFGVIKVLEEAGVKPDLIVGSSVGSLIGAFWASDEAAITGFDRKATGTTKTLNHHVA